MDEAAFERAAAAAMGTYADALDGRDWALLDHVFAPNVLADYGPDFRIDGREALVPFIRSFLDGCGPTQHLLGQTRIAGSRATRTQIRAFHLASEGGGTYEAIGTYHVAWTGDGAALLASHWRFEVTAHVGDPGILGSR